MNRLVHTSGAANGSEEGSALIAAIGVAFIGIALASIVVTTTIVAANDSGRDRVRTSEVHTAEGAVDSVFAELETSTPCQWPASGDRESGSSPSETSASATIVYFDASNVQLTCAAGVVSGDPVMAVVTGTASTDAGSVGRDPNRTIQAKVNLTPTSIPGRGAAIFAASEIMTTNGFTLETSLPDTPVDVWVDTGDVNCNSSVKIDGNLIVVDGKTDISGGCLVTQNLWSKKKLSVHTAHSAGLATVGMDTYVAADAMIAGGSKYGRDLIVSGAVSTWGTGPSVAGTYKSGVPASSMPQYLKVGLPEVNYIPADWTAQGFHVANGAQYKAWINQNAAANGSFQWDGVTTKTQGNECSVAGDNWSLNGPLLGPTVATTFDTRVCAKTTFQGNLNIKLRADMVIFANDFYATGNFQITSADGAQHRVWVIIPDPDVTPNGTADCGKTVGGNTSKDIKVDSGSLATAPITIFAYTPCKIETNNTSTFYGQLYGSNVVLRNAMTMRYVPIGIPGVDLPSTTPVSSSGFRVDVVYKREIKAP